MCALTSVKLFCLKKAPLMPISLGSVAYKCVFVRFFFHCVS